MKQILSLILLACSTFCYSDQQICSTKGCYKIIEKLGEGAFGAVYAVEDEQGQAYAMKTYHQSSPDFLEIGLQEAQREYEIGQILQHDNIIKSYDYFAGQNEDHHGTINIILQLVKGRTLYKSPKNTLPSDHAIQKIQKFVEALLYAHSLNYMHLDLHEENVMINDSMSLIILDLASFYSFENIFNWYNHKPASYRAKGLPLKNTKEEIKDKKIQDFFNRNPQLEEKLKQRQIQKRDAISESNSSGTPVTFEDFVSAISSFYIDRITETCVMALYKSNLDRETRLNLRMELKKISWSYFEDIDDEQVQPIENYLYRIQTLFQEAK